MPQSAYDWLMAQGQGDPFDRHLFACLISSRCRDSAGRLGGHLGLNREAVMDLLAAHFPRAARLWDGEGCLRSLVLHQAGQGHQESEAEPEDPALAEEMADIRDLLLEHADPGCPQSAWLAAMVARTCLRSSHLWEDFGLSDRSEISELMRRHFPALAARNAGSRMRWKKFLYKQLCERAEIRVCRAPNCQVCDEYRVCFSIEQSERDATVGLVWGRSQVA